MIAPTSPPTTTQVLALSHVALKASSIENACAFYGAFLGFAEQCRLNYLTTGQLMLVCFKVSEDQWIEIFTGLRPGENRMHQVAFRVRDAEEMRLRLADHGVSVPEKTPIGQMGNFNFVVSDPADQIIEFVEHRPSGITERDRGRFLPVGRIAHRIRHARIVTPALDRIQPFYDVLGLASVETSVMPTVGNKGSVRRSMPTGDFVEFVPDLASQAQFSLEVRDLAEATHRLEHSPYRNRYPKPLERETQEDGQRFLDLVDPDGTIVRLIEPHGEPVV